MGNYEPKVGDRVRATFELDVVSNRGPVDGGGCVCADRPSRIRLAYLKGAVSIEKVEPPVKVFKPGTVIRHRYYRADTYAVVEGGLVRLTGSGYMSYPNGAIIPTSRLHYGPTSAHYERVTL